MFLFAWSLRVGEWGVKGMGTATNMLYDRGRRTLEDPLEGGPKNCSQLRQDPLERLN
jgi:hypothetical protein